ncbi:hypothetical protein [Alienimonas chondri]|uniref:Sulphur transport domain-containing protein n=1 Tax=Alienimonas chondri TaxID=2681879 RepID=A0ABX1VC74_9PLAN|nr:hypothetical protein [Alienimonas chondri]NNJ25353.1 hypothetical protein [Alienimonas chondri]
MRLPIFLVAGLIAAAVCLVAIRQIHTQVIARTEVYIAPRGATEEQIRKETESARRRDFIMDAAALSFAAAVMAGAFGIAAGACGPPRGASAKRRWPGRTLRGLGSGMFAGVLAGLLGATATTAILASPTAADWGGAVGDTQLFPVMIAYALQWALIGAAAGCAVRLASGDSPKRSVIGATRGLLVAGAAAGVVWGLLAPIAGVIVGTMTTQSLDARGFYRAIPDGRPGQALLLVGLAVLAGVALARVSGRPTAEVEATPAAV